VIGRVPSGTAGGAPPDDALVIVGRVRKPQGLHGEVLVESMTDAPDTVFASGARVHLGTTDGDPARDDLALTVERTRPFKTGYLIRFAGVATRDDVEAWRGRYLLASGSVLPAPAPDEVYLHELLGMQVSDEAAGRLGEITEVYELPQGVAVEVSGPRGSVIVPWRPEIVREVDVDARVVRIAAPPGLLD
jgi:16S rRNA processing protein RimM